MADLDRKMIEQYHVDLLMMMENAGKTLAVQSMRLLGSLTGRRILILAGKGNNGGGGLAAARHMHNWGAKIQIAMSSPQEESKETTRRQIRILEAMKTRTLEDRDLTGLGQVHLVVDALLGYNQKGDPRGRVAELVQRANESDAPILSLDIPTGLDPDKGIPNSPCIRATQTLTLAFPKTGLLRPEAKPYVGKLFLADISVPREVYEALSVDQESLFGSDFIVAVE